MKYAKTVPIFAKIHIFHQNSCFSSKFTQRWIRENAVDMIKKHQTDKFIGTLIINSVLVDNNHELP